MAAQLPSYQNAVPPLLFPEGPGGADLNTLAAGKALGEIQYRPPILKRKGVFPAGLNASPTLTAGFIGNIGPPGSEQP
jgi:hypothetical protein